MQLGIEYEYVFDRRLSPARLGSRQAARGLKSGVPLMKDLGTSFSFSRVTSLQAETEWRGFSRSKSPPLFKSEVATLLIESGLRSTARSCSLAFHVPYAVFTFAFTPPVYLHLDELLLSCKWKELSRNWRGVCIDHFGYYSFLASFFVS